jgi:hypothetical protein
MVAITNEAVWRYGPMSGTVRCGDGVPVTSVEETG